MASFASSDVPSPDERGRRLARWLALAIVLASVVIDLCV